MKNTYSLKILKKQVKIYINNIIHLAIKQDELIGIHSWLMGYNDDRKYCIEFTTKTNTIISEYDEIEKWKAILALLDKNEIY